MPIVGDYFIDDSVVNQADFGQTEVLFGVVAARGARRAVVHMGDAVRAGVYAGIDLVVDRVVVSERNLHAFGRIFCGEYVGAFDVWRDGHASDDVEIALDETVVVKRGNQQLGRMRSCRLLGQIRPLEVGADDACIRRLALVGANRVDRLFDVFGSRGHRRRAVRGYAGVEVIRRNRRQTFFGRLHTVVAPAAVRVDVDEPGGAYLAAAVDDFAFADGAD